MKTHVSFRPPFYWTFDTLLGINPPVLSHVGKMSETKVVEMHQEPLSLLLRILGLIGLERLYIELGRVDDFAMRFLKEVKRKLQ